MSAEAAVTLDQVIELYERWGTEHYDEDLSQLDHALQTAALASRGTTDEALIVAALLHDVGHLIELAAGGSAPSGSQPNDSSDLHHEAVGAKYLGSLFGPTVTEPIALHVRAKRYRCAVDAAYAAGLSAGSTRSLERQGGPLDARAATAFEQLPGAHAAISLRAWDDGGKVDGLEVPDLASYLPMMRRAMRQR